jgi:hypothetical protein
MERVSIRRWQYGKYSTYHEKSSWTLLERSDGQDDWVIQKFYSKAEQILSTGSSYRKQNLYYNYWFLVIGSMKEVSK